MFQINKMYKSSHQNCETKFTEPQQSMQENNTNKMNEIISLVTKVHDNHENVTNQLSKLQKQVNKLTSSNNRKQVKGNKTETKDKSDTKADIPTKENSDNFKAFKKESILSMKTKCSICENFPKLQDNSDGEHLLSTKNGRDFVLMESCPKLRNFTIPQKHELLTLAKVCRICCKYYHDENKCRYTSRYKYTQCEAPKCRKKYTICQEHVKENEDKLQNLKKLLNSFDMQMIL